MPGLPTFPALRNTVRTFARGTTIGQKQFAHGLVLPAKKVTRGTLAGEPNAEWIAYTNAQALSLIERQGRSGLGLVPFVGAGLSVGFGFKDWRSLLLSASPPELQKNVRLLLDANDYEGAAEVLLVELGADGFQNMVAVEAGDRRLASQALRSGTLALLPLLADGPVVTTNFDRLLEHAFTANGRGFESVVSGPRPDLIFDALHGNRRVLIKLHGDWQDRVGRTFARSDYEAHYGDNKPAQKRELLDSAQRLLFSSRSMLFVGASLGPDRTVQTLQKVQQEYAGVRHFAVMTAPIGAEAFRAKERQLRSLGVMPLWYRASTGAEHVAEVEKLVRTIVERISVHTLEPAPVNAARPPTVQPTPASPPGASVDADTPAAMRPQLERVVNLIHAGRLNFFLGSAVHLPMPIQAKHFYEELARTFECEALVARRSAVTQHIADRHGREALYAEIDKLLERSKLLPRETHEFFAAWPNLRTPDGDKLPWPTVFTSNYDDVLERRLDRAGVPFHVLSYHCDGDWPGLFCHLGLDRSLRVIERPRNLLALEPGMIVVKLNGGRDTQGRMRRSFVTTRVDYTTLAARIPEALPAVLQRNLSDRPMLFLGHGLVESDVEALVRYAHRDHRGIRSWAVVKDKKDVDYWRQCGVELIDQPLNAYISALWRLLVGASPAK